MDQIKQQSEIKINSLKNENLDDFTIKQLNLSSNLSSSQNFDLNKISHYYEKGTKDFMNNHYLNKEKIDSVHSCNTDLKQQFQISNHFDQKFNEINNNFFLDENYKNHLEQNYLFNENFFSNSMNNTEKKAFTNMSESSELSLKINNKNFSKSLRVNHKSAFKPVRRKYSVYSFDNKIMNNVEFNNAFNQKLGKHSSNEKIYNENSNKSSEADETKQQVYFEHLNESILLQENNNETNNISFNSTQKNNYDIDKANYLQNKEKFNKETDISQYINKIISDNEAIVETSNIKLPKRNLLRNSTNNCLFNIKNKKILQNYRCNRSVSEIYSEYQEKIFHNSPKLESALRGNNSSNKYFNTDYATNSNNQVINSYSPAHLPCFNQKNSNSLTSSSIDDDSKNKFDINFLDVNSCLVENFLSTKKPTIKITPPSCETDTQKLMKNNNLEISIFKDLHSNNINKSKDEASFNNFNLDQKTDEEQLIVKNIEKCDLKNRKEQEELSCLVYVCTICNIAFRNKETLSAHQTHYCKNNLNVQQSSKSYFDFTVDNKKEDSFKNQLLQPNYSSSLNKKRKISEPAFLNSNFKKNLIFLKEETEKSNFQSTKDLSKTFKNTPSFSKNNSVQFTNFKTNLENENITRKISVLHQANNQYFISIKKPLVNYKQSFDHNQIPGLPSQIDEKMFNKNEFNLNSKVLDEKDNEIDIEDKKALNENSKKLNLDDILKTSFLEISDKSILEKTKRFTIISEYLPHFNSKITIKGKLLFDVLRQSLKKKDGNLDFNYSESGDNFENSNKVYKTKQVSSMPKFIFEDSTEQKSSQNNLMNLSFQNANSNKDDLISYVDENNNESLANKTKCSSNENKKNFNENFNLIKYFNNQNNEKLSFPIVSSTLLEKKSEIKKKIANFSFDKPFTKLICSNLVSPDTPRSEKNFVQSISNGQITTFISPKKSTRVTFCCIYRAQPMFIEQSLQPKLSMYSNWQIFPPYENLLSEFKASVLLACLDSRQWKHRIFNSTLVFIKNNSVFFDKAKNKNMIRNSIMEKYFEKINLNDDLCTTVCSLNWMIKKYKEDRISFKNELKEFKKKFCDESYDFNERLLKRRHRKPSKKTNEEFSSLANSQYDNSNNRSACRKQSNAKVPKRIFIFEGGFKSNEDYTYIRGRGKGKYVCAECGIRCKKPSMLRKHIRTHTDLRPYKCSHCNFAFKTKGNLTKHMKSKAHHKKCAELGINPVPTLIDALTQIDTKALALQEAMEQASNNYLNENLSTDLNNNIFDEDEEDIEEFFDDDHLVNDEIDDEQLDAKFGADEEDEEEEEDEEYVQRLNGVNQHLHVLKLKILSDSCSLKKNFSNFNPEKHEILDKYLDVDISFLTNYKSLGSFNSVIMLNNNMINKDKNLNNFSTYLEVYKSIKKISEKAEVTLDQNIVSKNSLCCLSNKTKSEIDLKKNDSSNEIIQTCSYSDNIKPHLKHKNNSIFLSNSLSCIDEEDNKIVLKLSTTESSKNKKEIFDKNFEEKVFSEIKDFSDLKTENFKESKVLSNDKEVLIENQNNVDIKSINDNGLLFNNERENYFHKKNFCKNQNAKKTKESIQRLFSKKIILNKSNSDFLDSNDKSCNDYISFDKNQLAVDFRKHFKNTLDFSLKYENKINALTTGEIQKNVTYFTEGGDLTNQQVVIKDSYFTDDVLNFNEKNSNIKIRENDFSSEKSSLSDISTTSRKLSLNCIINNSSLNSEVLKYSDSKSLENIRSKSLPPLIETNKNQLEQKRSKSVFSMKVNEIDEHEVACSLLSLSENWENKNNLNSKKLSLSLPLKRKYSNYMNINKVYNTLEKKPSLMDIEAKKNETQIYGNLNYLKAEKPVNLSKKHIKSLECEDLQNKNNNLDDSTDSKNSVENQYSCDEKKQRQIQLRKISIHIQNTIDKHEKILNYGSLPVNSSNSSPVNKQPIDQCKTNICNICNKTFSEESQLRLHENIHFFERPFRCDVCSVSFRSQGHLMKHQRSLSHLNKLNMNSTFGQPSIDNPRPFKCTDCKSGYRIHGHLAKHLRSKIHIGKLESLGKLPPGLYSLMERNQIQLNDLDTTDCETSFQCLLKLSQRLQANGDLPNTNFENKSSDKKFYPDKNINENLLDQKKNLNKPNLNNQVFMMNNILYETPNDQYFNLKNKYFFENYSSSQSIDPNYNNSLSSINVDLTNNFSNNNFFKNTDNLNFSHYIPQQQFYHQQKHHHHLYPQNNFEFLPHGHPIPEFKINEQKSINYSSLALGKNNNFLKTKECDNNVQTTDKKSINDYASDKTKPLSSVIASTRSNTCSICNQVFKSAKFLQVHLYSDHINSSSLSIEETNKNELKKFQCKICGNKYDDKDNYEIHLTSHLIPRPFVCDYCDAGFTNIDFLNSHLKTHTKL